MKADRLKILVYLASEVLIILGVFFTVCMILGVTRGLPPGPGAYTYGLMGLFFSFLAPVPLILTRVMMLRRSARTESEWKTYVEALCKHLREIGLKATVESKPPPIGFWTRSSPIVIYLLIFALLSTGFMGLLTSTETLWMGVGIGVVIFAIIMLLFFDPQSDLFLTQFLDFPFTGSIRVANRNIDLIELEKVKLSRALIINDRAIDLDIYRCNYVVQAKVDGLEDKLKAKAKPVTVQKDPKSWEVVDITWEGGELAQLLNSDANLRNTLSHIKDTVFQHLEITPDRILERVRMWADYPLPKSAFPTIETFEAFDRIAKHVRRIAGIHP